MQRVCVQSVYQRSGVNTKTIPASETWEEQYYFICVKRYIISDEINFFWSENKIEKSNYLWNLSIYSWIKLCMSENDCVCLVRGAQSRSCEIGSQSDLYSIRNSVSYTPFLLLLSNRKFILFVHFMCSMVFRSFSHIFIAFGGPWICLLRDQKFARSTVWRWFSVFFPYIILINIFFMGRSCRWRYAIRMSCMKDALWLVDISDAVCARKNAKKVLNFNK